MCQYVYDGFYLVEQQRYDHINAHCCTTGRRSLCELRYFIFII